MRDSTVLPRWLALCITLTGLVAALAPLPAVAARTGALSRDDTLSTCAWNKPGHDPFMGNVVGAVDRYADIPAPVRERLKERMAKRQYDDIAEITRDRIEGRSHYAPAISSMHFGNGRMCKTVTRDAWTSDMHERGLVYCDSGECIIVPTVCRNVSRVSRDAESPAMAEGPLLFDPPGAGAGALPAGLGGAPGRAAPLGMAIDSAPVFEAPQEQAYAQGVPFAGGMSSFPVGPIVAPSRPDGPAGLPPPALSAVPEPSSIALLLMGGALVAVASRRRVAQVASNALR